MIQNFRREKWKKRQEEKRILEEIFLEQRGRKIKQIPEEKEEFSYGACLAEGCILGNF